MTCIPFNDGNGLSGFMCTRNNIRDEQGHAFVGHTPPECECQLCHMLSKPEVLPTGAKRLIYSTDGGKTWTPSKTRCRG